MELNQENEAWSRINRHRLETILEKHCNKENITIKTSLKPKQSSLSPIATKLIISFYKQRFLLYLSIFVVPHSVSARCITSSDYCFLPDMFLSTLLVENVFSIGANFNSPYSTAPSISHLSHESPLESCFICTVVYLTVFNP